MKKAVWNGQTLAQSNDLEEVEGNYYFPASSLNMDYFEKSNTTSVCPWKGTAAYYHLKAGGEQLEDAAWYYPNPKEAAQHIEGRVAFYPSVDIIDA